MAGGPAPVDWSVAEKVAVAVARRQAPEVDRRTREALESDFAEMTGEAEGLVSEATGLKSLAGPARAEVTDRAGWIRANLASFRRLLTPLLERHHDENKTSLTARLPEPLQKATRAAAGAELGALLGWMSSRVLGQYDLLLTEDADSEGDVVYFVGPNVVQLERRHGFASDEFRLWIAIHELTHRAQFTGVEWMRPHFLSLVDRAVSAAAPDSKAMAAALKKMAAEIAQGRNPIAENGLIGVFASPEQQDALRSAQALMSLLEGHGDIVMNTAGAARVPGAGRFSSTLQRRRESTSGVSKLLQQLIGLDAKMRQYKDGEHFVESVEAAGGPALFRLVWEEASYLPTLEEIREPQRWIDRVGGRSLQSA